MEEQKEINPQRILEEIGKVAFGEAGDQSSANLKYSNKLKALEMLAKHFGMYDFKPEENTQGGVVLLGASDPEPTPPEEGEEENL